MSRQKKYNKEVVTDKAMQLLWSNGYYNTSARMLEREMGINLFSIYSTFQNKDGVYLASVQCYKNLIRRKLLIPLSNKPKNIATLKDFFYDFLTFTKEDESYRGCLLINSVNELGTDMTENIAAEITSFSEEIESLISSILKENKPISQTNLIKTTNYVFVALQGIVLTSKTINQIQIDDYIELTFSRL